MRKNLQVFEKNILLGCNMIYLDSAATSFPKPDKVIEAVAGVMGTIGANPGRAGHKLSIAAGKTIWRCREVLAELMDIPTPENIVFGCNCTDALNLAIRGCLSQGDHVITTMLEHNSVLRPINGMVSRGLIEWSLLAPGADGVVTAADVQKAIRPNTKLIVVNHASNVIGLVQPVAEIGRVARKHNIIYLVDAAQSMGILPVKPLEIGASMVAFPGHKGLLGPMGTGGLYVSDDVRLTPYREGGTGSSSESMLQPADLPEALESGTLNLPGIAGLLVGARIAMKTQEETAAHEHNLAVYLWRRLRDMPRVTMLTNREPDVGVVAFNVQGYSSGEIAVKLDRANIAVRGGLHCAPAIHTHLGTLSTGAVRASMGHATTREDVDALIKVVSGIK